MFERDIGLTKLFEQAADRYNNQNIKTMRYNTEDRGKDAKEYSMCYDKTNPSLKQFCGPDWVFYHWPSANIQSFEEIKQQIIQESYKEPLIDKIGWFGNLSSPKPDVPEFKTRPLLKKIGDSYPHLFDIMDVVPVKDKVNEQCKNYLSIPDLVKYKYLIDIGGNGYSGRIKYLLFSRRPLLLVERRYIEYFHDDLIAYVHYIPVKEDLSDLLTQVDWIRNNPTSINQIAQNAYNYAVHNFTEAKVYERIAEVYKNLTQKN